MQILLPTDQGYEDARRVWNGMIDRRPAMIARCTNTADVAAAVRLGRERGLEIGVRGGGHSIVGHAVPDAGLMIDLSPMGGVRVDPDRRRAWVQGGALLGALDEAAQRFGLATTAGNVSHTGVGGLTLGGGMGWLARQYGLACDNVAEYVVVSADGTVLRVSESDSPDLYWGLRGGGGNYGVVTEFEFRLHPVGTTAFTADLFYSRERARDAMRRWRDLIPEASRKATFTAWTGIARDWPFLPEELRNGPLTSVGFVWVGDPDEARPLLAALREATPAAERIRSLSYLALQQIDDDPQRRSIRRYWKGHYLREFNDEAIDAFLSRGIRHGDDVDPALMPSGDLQSYGGTIGSVGEDDTAFAHRETLVEFVARAGWTDPAEDDARISMARRYGGMIEPYATGLYVNDMTDEGDRGLQRAYGTGKLTRLAALKARYDPENVFHLNHNIGPSLRVR